MRNLLYILLFVVFAQQAIAQNNQFNYQIQRIDSTSYEMQLQLFEPENVQFIRVQIIEDGYEIKTLDASLNKKLDGKYYLFFNEEEHEAFIENLYFSFDHNNEDSTINIGYLQNPSIKVTLLNSLADELSYFQKTID